MKPYFQRLFTVLLVVCLLANCSKSPVAPAVDPHSIVGSWTWESSLIATVPKDGTPTTTIEQKPAAGSVVVTTYSTQGTVSTKDVGSTPQPVVYVSGSYSYQDDTLRINTGYSLLLYKVIKLDAHRLQLLYRRDDFVAEQVITENYFR